MYHLDDSEDKSDQLSDYSGWSDEEEPALRCLFCTEDIRSIKAYTDHLSSHHDFDLKAIIKELRLDIYQSICLINYTRSFAKEETLYSVDPVKLARDLYTSKDFRDSIFKNEKYFKPVLLDDAVLYMIEEFMDEPEDENNNSNSVLDKSESQKVNTVAELELKLSKAQKELQRCHEIIKSLVGGQNDLVAPESPIPTRDPSYFKLYESLNIHDTMLKDKVRTETYKKFIEEGSSIFRGKTVLDIGCGTSILSLFCAKAGAKRVYSVDNAKQIVELAAQIVRDNNFDDTIVLIEDLIENAKLNERVDVIISEWMGYFLFFEKMLDSVIEARDKFLKPGGLALRDIKWHNSKSKFWENVYGFNMSTIKPHVFKEIFVETVDPQTLVSQPFMICELRILEVKIQDLDFNTTVKIVPYSPGPITGLCGWFDVIFDVPEVTPITLSTSPRAQATHWHQSIMGFDRILDLENGDHLLCKLTFKGRRSSTRDLAMELHTSVLNSNDELKEEISMNYILT